MMNLTEYNTCQVNDVRTMLDEHAKCFIVFVYLLRSSEGECL